MLRDLHVAYVILGHSERRSLFGEDDAFVNRKSFAFSPEGDWQESPEILRSALKNVTLTFQNIDSFEIGLSDIDHYYEYLGGDSKSVEVYGGAKPKVMVGDTGGFGKGQKIRSLDSMVALEARTKLSDLRNKLAGNEKLEDILADVLRCDPNDANLPQRSRAYGARIIAKLKGEKPKGGEEGDAFFAATSAREQVSNPQPNGVEQPTIEETTPAIYFDFFRIPLRSIWCHLCSHSRL